MTFTLRESLWLHEHGFEDLLLGYPTVDRDALARLAALDVEPPPVLMVDSTDQLDLIDAAAPRRARPVRVCLDFDTSLRAGRRPRADRAQALTAADARAGRGAGARRSCAAPASSWSA